MEINQIEQNLFLGSVFATHPDALKKHNIKHIISLGCKPAANQASSIYFDVIDLDDPITLKQMDKDILPSAYKFILEKTKLGENVLVHCMAGRSRSATVVIYYLMKKYAVSYDKASEYVQSKRPEIMLNNGFKTLLRSYSFIF